MVHNVRAIVGDFVEQKLDLNKKLVKHPAATFFVRVSGNSMRNLGINHDDILVVDRSLTPKMGSVIVAVAGGEFVLRQIKNKNRRLTVWGVVTNVIHKV